MESDNLPEDTKTQRESDDFLLQMALNHGLPYFRNITLDDLYYYNEMHKLKLLKKASKSGDARVVERILNIEGIKQLSDYDDYFNKSILKAAKRGHIKVMQVILCKGDCDINDIINVAAQAGHIEMVEFLIEKGATNLNGAMVNAAYGGRIDMIKWLLNKGATDIHNTVIAAAFNGHIDIVKLMLEMGANNLDTLKNIAKYRGHKNIEDLIA